jgi:hypothetical protein
MNIEWYRDPLESDDKTKVSYRGVLFGDDRDQLPTRTECTIEFFRKPFLIFVHKLEFGDSEINESPQVMIDPRGKVACSPGSGFSF